MFSTSNCYAMENSDFFQRCHLFIFRERGRKAEREGQKDQCVVASCTPPCEGREDLARNPGMCPDWELNWRPFGSLVGAQSTEPHQPGQKILISIVHLNYTLSITTFLVICKSNGGWQDRSYRKMDNPIFSILFSGVSNLWPMGYMDPRTAVNAAQHKILNLLKTLWDFFVWLRVRMYLMCGQRQLFSSMGQRHQKAGHPWLKSSPSYTTVSCLINVVSRYKWRTYLEH